MSLEIRRRYFKNLIKKIPFKVNKINDLMAEVILPKDKIKKFQIQLINYMNASITDSNKFIDSEKKIINYFSKYKDKIQNITPNGSIIPKRENNFEFGVLAKNYCQLLNDLNIYNKINKVHFPFNIRIKFEKIKKGHMLRKHPTETMHADGWTGADPAWVAIHFFLLGDISKNHILYAYPPNDFQEDFLAPKINSKEGLSISKKYKLIKYVPKKGSLIFADNSILHCSFRKKNSGVRVSLDTGIDLINKELKSYKRKTKKYNVDKIRSKEEIDKKIIFNIGRNYFPVFPDSINIKRNNMGGFKHSSKLKIVKIINNS